MSECFLRIYDVPAAWGGCLERLIPTTLHAATALCKGNDKANLSQYHYGRNLTIPLPISLLSFFIVLAKA